MFPIQFFFPVSPTSVSCSDILTTHTLLVNLLYALSRPSQVIVHSFWWIHSHIYHKQFYTIFLMFCHVHQKGLVHRSQGLYTLFLVSVTCITRDNIHSPWCMLLSPFVLWMNYYHTDLSVQSFLLIHSSSRSVNYVTQSLLPILCSLLFFQLFVCLSCWFINVWILQFWQILHDSLT